MLFKNLVFHRLPANWELSAADFETQLAGRTLKPCGPFDMSSRGSVPVTGDGRLLHTVHQQHMGALRADEAAHLAGVARSGVGVVRRGCVEHSPRRDGGGDIERYARLLCAAGDRD